VPEETTRNPVWTWDEIVLACDLVAANRWRALDANDPRVRDLSALLQRLPIHPPAERGATFRNPNGVARKTADIATAHPEYRGRPTRGGLMDREVLAAFLTQGAQMRRAAEAIRAAEAAGNLDNVATVAVDDLDVDPPEGRLLLRLHLTRERSRSLRERKIKKVLARGGSLACEACSFDFEQTYGPRGAGYIECHHIVPLHALGPSTTSLDDLALLCANCHRMIHRMPPWLSPTALRGVLDARYERISPPF
jgi:5-methylcytosine-specific restriction protein A